MFIDPKILKKIERDVQSKAFVKYAKTPEAKQAMLKGKMEALDGFGNSHK